MALDKCSSQIVAFLQSFLSTVCHVSVALASTAASLRNRFCQPKSWEVTLFVVGQKAHGLLLDYVDASSAIIDLPRCASFAVSRSYASFCRFSMS